MARFILLIIGLFISPFVFAQTELLGKVTDAKTGEAIFAANVVILNGERLVTGAETDFDGNYSITNLDAGIYTIRCSYTLMIVNMVQTFTIEKDVKNQLDFAMKSDKSIINVCAFDPIINLHDVGSGKKCTKNQIRALPTKNLSDFFSIFPNY